MKPIALAFKNQEINPFTNRNNGELMIVHKCLSCSQISPNRIAGDDNEYQILSILGNSFNISSSPLLDKINVIKPENKEEVYISLFGINFKKIE